MFGWIYSITSESHPNLVYIGCTTKKYICQRAAQHRYDYHRYLNGNYSYVSAFDILKYKDAVFKTVCKVEVDSKQHLNDIERLVIRGHGEQAVNRYNKK